MQVGRRRVAPLMGLHACMHAIIWACLSHMALPACHAHAWPLGAPPVHRYRN